MTGEIVKRDERIRQLERLNATLAAEIDRMRPVVEAVRRITEASVFHASLLPLHTAILDYELNRPDKA